ncbi:hypothetical protein ABYF34_01975 [Buchananella felis]|uniref:hypothetical protein n=1 Tax=Buchananella felis TaxID=3231492 RepID=UPI0035288A11
MKNAIPSATAAIAICAAGIMAFDLPLAIDVALGVLSAAAGAIALHSALSRR